MPKHGKKFMAALAKVDRDRSYEPAEAIALAKEHRPLILTRR
jgi:large subunit ribosomal protein L1